MRLLPAVLVGLLLLAGCASHAPAAPPPTDKAQLPANAPLTAWLHDLSPKDKGIKFANAKIEHYRVPAEEGVALDTWVALPPGPGPFPLILTLTPYYAGGAPTTLGRLGDEFLARGYAVGKSTVRGTGMSGGCFEQGSEKEGRDSAGVVEYLAAQPWSNGNVGMIGVSYEGTTPGETWIEAPPHLKTIVPIAGITDFYKYNFVNGVPIFIQGYGFNTYYWADEDVLFNDGPPGDPTDVPGVVQSASGLACPDQADVQQGGVSSTADGNKDAYWQSRDFVARLDQRIAAGKTPTASVFYVHGLQDWNVKDHMEEGWLDALRATHVPLKVLLGQWPHAWPQSTNPSMECKPTSADPVAACRNDWWNATLVAWFDQFLKNKDTGILDAPPVQVEDDAGVWRNEASWPPADGQWNVLHPTADGSLGLPMGSGSADYSDAGGDLGAADFVGVGTPASGALPAEARFTSAPVAVDLHIAGSPQFVGNVTSAGPRASLVLTLAEQRPDGSLRPFNFGALSLNHAAGLESGNPDIAGLRQAVRVPFFFQDDVVHAGSRIVLIAAGNVVAGDQPAPGLQPVSAGGRITIDLGGASLLLPIDPGIVPEARQPFD